MLLLLLACATDPDDTGGYEGCRGAPQITITSPEEGTTINLGESVTLEGTATSTVDDAVVLLWAVDGDVEVIGGSGTWMPESAGTFLLTLQAEDECGISQDERTVIVRSAAE
jgi:hypothetical protein